MNLSPGKRRALATLSNAKGIFTILALDHAASFRNLFFRLDPSRATYQEIVATKLEMVRALAPHASAVLLDPRYAIGAALEANAIPGSVGLLSPMEDEDYATPDPEQPSRLLEGWSVAQAKRIGVNGIKFFCYYSSRDADKMMAEDKQIARLVNECGANELPLFPEPIVYGVSPPERRHAVIENAKRMNVLGADVLKMEFPLETRLERDESAWREACEELSDSIRVPWTLLSAGADYETFKTQVRVACAAGASGFVAGRAIWQEAAAVGGTARRAFLENVAVLRLRELSDIASEYGKSWAEFYPSLESTNENWYTTYPK